MLDIEVFLDTWPAQGDGFDKRNGKTIQNVKMVCKIKLTFWNNTIPVPPAVVDYTNNIMYHTWRVIVWTAAEDADATAFQFNDFWRLDESVNPIDLIPINRSKVIVLVDKVYNMQNVNFFPTVQPNLTAEPIMCVKYLTVKRKWNKIMFPNNASVTPTKEVNRTYLTVLPYKIHNNSLVLGKCQWRTNMYYTD